MQKKQITITGEKVHDLRLINFTHSAHFKELQGYFEVYLLLMTFPKNGLNGLLHSRSFLQVTAPPNHKDGVSTHMMSYKQI